KYGMSKEPGSPDVEHPSGVPGFHVDSGTESDPEWLYGFNPYEGGSTLGPSGSFDAPGVHHERESGDKGLPSGGTGTGSSPSGTTRGGSGSGSTGDRVTPSNSGA